MKSANILLDDKWSAKVSDFGLSIMGPANEQHSVVVTNPVGTYGYCDPQYVMTHTLTKESDVYSFGVVLFEVLCGTLCCTYRANGVVEKNFVPMWIESYKQNKLDDIIFKDPTIQPIDQCALETFSDIAYRCLTESREDRPKMAEVVTELETAYEIQELSEWMHPFDYEEMTKTAYPRLNYKSKGELGRLLLKGVLLNDGNTWFSLNKNREHCVMISFAECLDSAPSEFTSKKSRFVVGPYQYENGRVKTHVKTQFLTPLITYAVNLVFKFRRIVNKTGCPELVRLKYKLQGETESSIAYLADERKDGWWMCELYQFTSQDHRTIDLEIIFDGFHGYHYFGNAIEVEGIEFRPLEKVEHKDEDQPISDSDANWEEKLPVDYEDMLKWSKNSMQWTTKKEAYSIMRKGFLINDGQEWLSLDKNGKKCYMLSARVAGSSGVSRSVESVMLPVPESRFGEAIECHSWELSIDGYIKLQLVSSQTTYASYLIYKLPKDQSEFEAPILVKYKVYDSCYIYLVNPQTPIIRPNADQNTHNPLNMPKIKGVPQQRNDGWMEVQIWEFRSARTAETILLHLYLKSCATKKFKGLIVEGVEFRPTDTNKLFGEAGNLKQHMQALICL
ncbi:hypothetical protein QVD17_26917 [Tagetes erecta]|uniref:Protein kinase domain-containing protein n=1 Tax=Tagetes erecta TaxID=13708 RepID=A0AAD8NR70_TARER|nr:hypothetical protein QVD17_26917 [Tagetes erecta]